MAKNRPAEASTALCALQSRDNKSGVTPRGGRSSGQRCCATPHIPGALEPRTVLGSAEFAMARLLLPHSQAKYSQSPSIVPSVILPTPRAKLYSPATSLPRRRKTTEISPGLFGSENCVNRPTNWPSNAWLAPAGASPARLDAEAQDRRGLSLCRPR
jgi:hypothetical protein